MQPAADCPRRLLLRRLTADNGAQGVGFLPPPYDVQTSTCSLAGASSCGFLDSCKAVSMKWRDQTKPPPEILCSAPQVVSWVPVTAEQKNCDVLCGSAAKVVKDGSTASRIVCSLGDAAGGSSRGPCRRLLQPAPLPATPACNQLTCRPNRCLVDHRCRGGGGFAHGQAVRGLRQVQRGDRLEVRVPGWRDHGQVDGRKRGGLPQRQTHPHRRFWRHGQRYLQVRIAVSSLHGCVARAVPQLCCKSMPSMQQCRLLQPCVPAACLAGSQAAHVYAKHAPPCRFGTGTDTKVGVVMGNKCQAGTPKTLTGPCTASVTAPNTFQILCHN